jgi:hypothetical protein
MGGECEACRGLRSRGRRSIHCVPFCCFLMIDSSLAMLTGNGLKDQQPINSYRLETTSKSKQVEQLSDPEHPRVSHHRCRIYRAFTSHAITASTFPFTVAICQSRSVLTGPPLRCLVDHETECPSVLAKWHVNREVQRSDGRLADQYELFLSGVQEKRFAAVAGGEYLI